MRYDAVVLAGGPSRRLGGADKALVDLGGVTMLERAVAACRGAERVVVAGPRRKGPDGVVWTMEDPPGGGPAAGMRAALAQVREEIVVVVAVDMPFVTSSVVEALLDALDGREGAMLRDAAGRDQYLGAAYRTDALRAALAFEGVRSMKAAVEQLAVTRIDAPEAAEDCDTWEDVERARRRASSEG